MKREDDDTQPTHTHGTFAERVREGLHRGTETARRMIERVRELVEPTEAEAKSPNPPPSPVHTALTHAPPHARDATDDDDDDPETDTQAPPTDLAVTPEFATATMGAILLEQGRPREAMVVFMRLLARNPHHAEALRGLEASRAAVAPKLPVTEPVGTGEQLPPEPASMLDRDVPPDHYDESFVRALPVDPNSLVVFWELTAAALRAARDQMGPHATLALRIVSEHGGHRTERFVDGVPPQGDFFVLNLPRGAAHHATLGIRTVGGFAAFGEAESVSTPRGAPTRDVVRVQGTVLIPPRTEGGPAVRPRFIELLGPQHHVAQLVRRHAHAPVAQAVLPLDTPTLPARPAGAPIGSIYDDAGSHEQRDEALEAFVMGRPSGEVPSSSTPWDASGSSSPTGAPWSRPRESTP